MWTLLWCFTLWPTWYTAADIHTYWAWIRWFPVQFIISCKLLIMLWFSFYGLLFIWHLLKYYVIDPSLLQRRVMSVSFQIFQSGIPGWLEDSTLEINRVGGILRNAMAQLPVKLGSLSYQLNYYGWNMNLVLIPHLCGWQINPDLYFITDMTVLVFI